MTCNTLLLVLILVSVSARPVRAGEFDIYRSASPEEYNEIVAVLDDVKVLESDRTKNRQAWMKSKNPEARADLDAKLIEIDRNRTLQYEKALWLTIQAYGILTFNSDKEPDLPSGKSWMRSPERRAGKSITWIPVFEDDVPHNFQNELGRILNGPPRTLGPEYQGNLASDGVARLLPNAFTSPGLLASTIIHEKFHFEQVITEGRADVLTPAESEVAAYEFEEKLRKEGILGLNADETRLLKSYLAKNLVIYKRKAAAQRARVDARGGLPLDEISVVSHSDDELLRLKEKARNQLKIANLDHDFRLQRILVDIALRSCANPGVVLQNELDGLAKPRNNNDFHCANMRSNGICENPQELQGVCLEAYQYLAGAIMIGEPLNEWNLYRASRPRPVAVPAIPVPPSIRPAPAAEDGRYFRLHLLTLKNFAEAACYSPGQALIPRGITSRQPFIFENESDNQTAADLARGLGECARLMFSSLIDMTRTGRQTEINRDWVQNKVAQFTPHLAPPPVYFDPCPGNGNKRCPRPGQ